MRKYLPALLALISLAREILPAAGVGYPRPAGQLALKNGAVSTTELVLRPDINNAAKIGSKITFHFKDAIAQAIKDEKQPMPLNSKDLIPNTDVTQGDMKSSIGQGNALPRLPLASDPGRRSNSNDGYAYTNSALDARGTNQGLPGQAAVVKFADFDNERNVPNSVPDIRGSPANDFLEKQKTATEAGSKKQFATDDFYADTMLHPPYIQSIEPVHHEPVDHPNHVEIDYPEDLHVDHMHQEMPLYPHIEHPIPVHVEEPVIVHHHEPPPPPPPEPVLIPIPIVTSPPPPPPPPPPCTVHIPVTIHLKGKLAIKMKHCENCDFSKNIEAIGPLKVSPINGFKGSLTGAAEAQARRIILTANDASEKKDNRFIEADYNEIRDALPGNATMSLDTELPGEEVGTKKDFAMRWRHGINQQHLIMARSVHIPRALVPSDAYKRGVVISLPKGKALLRCVVSRNENLTDATKSLGNTFNTGSEDTVSEKAEVASSVITPPSVDKIIGNRLHDDEESVSGEDARHELQEDDHGSVTDQFLKLFDKNMMISLYKMAVRDIMREFRRHRKNSNSLNTKQLDLRDKVESLFSQRSQLEAEYPGIGRSLVSFPPINQFPRRVARSLVIQSKRSSKEASQHDVLKASAGVRRVDTDHSAIRNDKKTFLKRPKSLHFQKKNLTDGVEDHHPIASLKSGTGESNSALSFYGDVDPSNLIDDGYGISNCIDVTCEKQKAFLTRAGSYFEDLDNLALQPYENFLRGEEKNIGIKNRKTESNLLKLPYGELIPLEKVRRFHVAKHKANKKNSPNVRRQSIFDALSRAAPARELSGLEEQNSKTGVSRKKSSDVSESVEHQPHDSPSTVVELYGKLPRVPLKITLNPKGPLAKLQRPITIDLKPPEPGRGPETASATTNDPNVMVRLGNKIFKDDPLDQKAQEKLQAVYADIRRRKRSVYRYPRASLQGGKRAKTPNTEKEKVQKGDTRTRIIVSLPRELTNLATYGYLRSNPSVAYRSQSPNASPAFAANSNADFGISRSESVDNGHQLGLTTSGVSYVVGEVNENKHVAALGQTPNEDARTQVEQFAKSLKALQEQAKQAMVHLHSMQQGEHDPYADIGSRRRFKGKDPHSDVGGKRRSRKGKSSKKDPYADIGVLINQDKRGTIRPQTTTDIMHKSKGTFKSKVVTDPYADIGGHMVISKRSGGHYRKEKKAQTKVQKLATSKIHSVATLERTTTGLKIPSAGKGQTKDSVPTGVAAQTLIRHLPAVEIFPKDNSQESKKAADSNMDSKILSGTSENAEHVQVAEKVITEPANEVDQTSIFEDFPKFSAALKKVNPRTREKLFEMKPFQFLKELKSSSKASKNAASKLQEQQRQGAAGKDPYADLGSAVDSSESRRHLGSSRSTVPSTKYNDPIQKRANAAQDTLENAQKRDSTDPDYDPYADVGTSIGLTQNESRMKSKATSEIAKLRDDSKSEATPDSKTASLEKSRTAHGTTEDRDDIFEKISSEAVTNLLASLKGQGITFKDSASHQLKAKFDKYSIPTENEQPDASTSFMENLQNGGYLKKSRAKMTQGQSRFMNQAASHISAYETRDPYADVGSSANGDPMPPNTKKNNNAQLKEVADQTTYRAGSTDASTEAEALAKQADAQPRVSLDSVQGRKELGKQVSRLAAKINKESHHATIYIGARKSYNETASAKTGANNDMNAGDLIEPFDNARNAESPSRVVGGEREVAKLKSRRMGDLSSSLHAHVTSESRLQPSADLSKTASYVETEVKQLPAVSLLLRNVGKEVQDPYTELGSTAPTKKKSLEAPAFARHRINLIVDSRLGHHPRSDKREAFNTVKRTNRLPHARQASIKAVVVTDVNSDHARSLENATNHAFEKIVSDEPNFKSCLPIDSRHAMQLLKHTAEASVGNLAGKSDAKTGNQESDPYLGIGTSVSGAKKQTLTRNLRICSFPNSLKNLETPASVDTKAIRENAEIKLGESGPAVTSSDQSRNIPDNATMQVEPVDPYAQLGTEVSSTRKRSHQSVPLKRAHVKAMNIMRNSNMSDVIGRSNVAGTQKPRARGLHSSGRKQAKAALKSTPQHAKKVISSHTSTKKLDYDPYADLGEMVAS